MILRSWAAYLLPEERLLPALPSAPGSAFTASSGTFEGDDPPPIAGSWPPAFERTLRVACSASADQGELLEWIRAHLHTPITHRAQSVLRLIPAQPAVIVLTQLWLQHHAVGVE